MNFSPKKDNYLVMLLCNVILNTSLYIKNFSPKKDKYLVSLLGNVISNTSLEIKLEPYI